MTVDDHTLTDRSGAPGPGSPPTLRLEAGADAPRPPKLTRRERRAQRPRVRKLRLLVVLVAFVIIAGLATVFGMLTSVASDLPGLSRLPYQGTVDSVLEDDTGQPIGVLAPPNNPVRDTYAQISKNMINGIVSVEDRRFWTDPGIDIKGLARAFLADATGGSTQGASTIAEEFVKNVEQEEDHRTVLEKLREAGLAFQLVHRWKRPKILDQYLNIIYFGNGAYGIEAAARIYFGKQLGYDPSDPNAGRCGTATVTRPHMPTCASLLRPYQAALLAGMVANPSAFDPIGHPQAARERRSLVLQDMVRQGYISRAQYEKGLTQPLPQAGDIQQPSEPSAAPYFTSWVRPQIIRALEKEGVPAKIAPGEAYYGGLKIKLTINLKMQQAAQDAVNAEFPDSADGPTASLVSIDNATGEVRAMVSGDDDYQADPFNLATLGYRQPGSSFKIFTLVQALESGKFGPDSVIDSHQLDIAFKGPHGETEHFPVHNDGNEYSGPITLSDATAISDNTVFAQVGMDVGTKNIAHQARLMGVRSPISTNPAMIIGGLRHGVSPLDMAHAYETLATGGHKITNPVLGDVDGGAVGIHAIAGCRDCRHKTVANVAGQGLTSTQVVPEGVAATIHEMLAGVVTRGTGTAAAIPGVEVVGKTGTTSNYVDAWFCGWTPELTTCVWVGYPDSGKPMLTNWNGQPVAGGTYPALIWHNYTESALNILASETGDSGSSSTSGNTGISSVPETTEVAPTGDETSPGATTAPAGNTGGTTAAGTSADTGGAADTGGTAATAGTAGTAGAAATNGATAGGSTGATAAPATTPAAATPPATAQPAPAAPSSGTSDPSASGSSSGATGGAGLGG